MARLIVRLLIVAALASTVLAVAAPVQANDNARGYARAGVPNGR